MKETGFSAMRSVTMDTASRLYCATQHQTQISFASKFFRNRYQCRLTSQCAIVCAAENEDEVCKVHGRVAFCKWYFAVPLGYKSATFATSAKHQKSALSIASLGERDEQGPLAEERFAMRGLQCPLVQWLLWFVPQRRGPGKQKGGNSREVLR